MRIDRLILKDFKSFREATLELGPATLLVGTNASGKSNLRDAFRFLHGVGLGYSLAEIIGEKYGPGGLLVWQGIRGGAREIARAGAASFSLTLEGHVALGLLLETPSPRYEIAVHPASNANGPELLREVPQVLWRGRHIEPSLFGPDDEFNAVEAWRLALQSFRFLDLHPDAMRMASQPGQHVLNPRGENLSSVVETLCKDPNRKESLLSWVRALTPMDAADLAFKYDHTGRVMLYLVERSGTEISAASASDGTLRFLAMAVALLGEDDGRLYFFEELDTGIHPTRLHLLLQLIDQATTQRGIQVVATTHNPALLAFMNPEQRVHAALIVRDAEESRIVRIADLPEITRVLETEDLGRLFAAGWLEDAAVQDPETVP